MTRSLEQRIAYFEDCDAIAKLQARYINLNDGGWEAKGPTHQFPEAVADLFVEDGTWEGPGTARAEGRDEIVALFRAFQRVRFIVHYVTNPLIEVDGDRAYGEWHVMVPNTAPSGSALWSLGLYKNHFVRTADGWRFEKLVFETAAVTPYELGWGRQQFVGDRSVDDA